MRVISLLRRRAKQAAVLAATLRGAFLPHTHAGTARVEVLVQHQLPCLPWAQLLLILHITPHAAGVAEARNLGDAIERGGAGLDRRPSGFQAQAFHGLCRSRPGLRREGAGNVPRTHDGAVGKVLTGQRLGEVRLHPLHQSDEAASFRRAPRTQGIATCPPESTSTIR